MRLGGRLSAAIEILADMESRHRPASEALKDWGLSHRFAGASDRAAIGNIVHDALRHRLSAARLMGSDTPRALAFGALLHAGGRTADALAATLEGDRFAPPPPDQKERASSQTATATPPPDAIRADCPEWTHPLLQRAYGDDWVEEAAALAMRPPLDLRVNTLKSDMAGVQAALARSGAAPCRLAASGLRIPPIEGDGRHPNVQAEPAFQKGWFEVQDEGSQVVSSLAGAQAGIQVLDFCAGAGGKTLALSAAMDNHGQIFAHDREKQRLAPIFDRLKRAGCRNVQTIAEPQDLEGLGENMDLVLVDAPCSGSGTWRRRPDAKWRLTARQLEMRQGEQDAILRQAARHVKPGGRLAYVTCSVFAEENEDRMAAFTANEPGFRPVDHGALWRHLYGETEGAARIGPETGIRLSPACSGTDGFYFAMLERRG